MTRGLGVLAVLVGAGFLASACQLRPSDETLRQDFYAHRAQFDALVTMIVHDKSLTLVDGSRTEPEDVVSIGLDAARIADYRRKLAAVGCLRFMYSPRSRAIYFNAWSTGFIWAGASKDFVYSPEAPPYGQHVENLDSYGPNYGGGATELYTILDNGWYLKLIEN